MQQRIKVEEITKLLVLSYTISTYGIEQCSYMCVWWYSLDNKIITDSLCDENDCYIGHKISDLMHVTFELYGASFSETKMNTSLTFIEILYLCRESNLQCYLVTFSNFCYKEFYFKLIHF
jgi:hypothetical protein